MAERYSSPTLSKVKNPDQDFLNCIWIGAQTDQSIRTGGRHILEIVKTHNVTKILNDNSLVVGLWHEAADWTFNTWFPELMSLGVKRFARIRAERMLPEISAKRAIPNTESIRSFNTKNEAIQWLTE